VTAADIERGYLDVEIDHRYGGFFAQLNWCLYIFEYARVHDLAVRVALISENYRVDANRRDWLLEFFDYRKPFDIPESEAAAHRKHIREHGQLGFSITPDLSLEAAHDVFFATLAIKPRFLAEADAFVAEHFAELPVLGIHYRGTDKGGEAELVTHETMAERARTMIAAGEYRTVFVASDEERFINYIETALGDVSVVSREDYERSNNDNAIHQHRAGGSLIGVDALLNALLLSRCDAVLRTTSFLSAWSAIINPRLKLETVNTPYADALYYPEREIIRRRTSALPDSSH
jgi:hypothetical protein